MKNHTFSRKFRKLYFFTKTWSSLNPALTIAYYFSLFLLLFTQHFITQLSNPGCLSMCLNHLVRRLLKIFLIFTFFRRTKVQSLAVCFLPSSQLFRIHIHKILKVTKRISDFDNGAQQFPFLKNAPLVLLLCC